MEKKDRFDDIFDDYYLRMSKDVKRDILKYFESYSREEVRQIFERVVDGKDIPANEVKEGMAGLWLQTYAGGAFLDGFGDAYEDFINFLDHDAYKELEEGISDDWCYPYKKLLRNPSLEEAGSGCMDLKDGNIYVIENNDNFYQEGIPKNLDVARLKGIEFFKEKMDSWIEYADEYESEKEFPDEEALENYDIDMAKNLLEDFITNMLEREQDFLTKKELIEKMNQLYQIEKEGERGGLEVLQNLVPTCYYSEAEELLSLIDAKNSDKTIENIRNNGSKELNELLDIAVIKHDAYFHSNYDFEPPISEERNATIGKLKSLFDPNDYSFYIENDRQIMECVMGAEDSLEYMAPAFGMFTLRGLYNGTPSCPTNLEINYAWDAIEKEYELNGGLSIESYSYYRDEKEMKCCYYLQPYYNPYSIEQLAFAKMLYKDASVIGREKTDFVSFLESEFCVKALMEREEDPKHIANRAIHSIKQSVFEKMENVVEQSKISDSASELIRNSLYEVFENIGIENLNTKKEKCDDFPKVQAVVSEVSRCVESQIRQVAEGVRNMQLNHRPIRRVPLDMIREELEQSKQDEFESKKNLVVGALESCANMLTPDDIEKISKNIVFSRTKELEKLDSIEITEDLPYDAKVLYSYIQYATHYDKDLVESLELSLFTLEPESQSKLLEDVQSQNDSLEAELLSGQSSAEIVHENKNEQKVQ